VDSAGRSDVSVFYHQRYFFLLIWCVPSSNVQRVWLESGLRGWWALCSLAGIRIAQSSGRGIYYSVWPRANIVFGNLVVAVGLAGMSIATEVWQIYLFYGIMVGLGSAFGLYLTCTTVVNNWFIRRRSLGMGLVISAGGLGGFLFPPLATWLISTFGLHMAWLALAMVQLVCAVMMGGLILVRNKPEDMGQLPDGILTIHDNEIEETIGNSSRVYQSSMDWQTRQAIRRPTTWLIATLLCRQLLGYRHGDCASSGISEGYRFFSHCGSSGPGPYSGNEHIWKAGVWLFRG